MIVRCTICVALCAALIPESGFAQSTRQTRQPGGRATMGSQRASRPARPPSGGVPASSVSMRKTQQPKIYPVSPELDALLTEWEGASSRVTKLSGEHRRRVYDMVFKVEKISMGHFYHEVPDKGRIDIEPVKIPEGAKSKRSRDGKAFALISDMQEKWICDGKRIIEMNEPEKSATFMSIPPRGQGENIMNGPLPFLFGMEADKAKRRYQLKLISDKVNPNTRRRELEIQAFPRWATDGQNWNEARIILDHPSFLPLHVKLVDAGKTKETVFSFRNLKVNKKAGFFKILTGQSPFRPNLRGYKINTLAPGKDGSTSPPVGQDEVVIPNVVHFTIEDAKARMKQAGLVVAKQYVRGGAAPMPRLVHKIADVVPKPMTAVKRGSAVKLVVFERSK